MKQVKNTLRRTAAEVKRYRILKKIVPALIAIIIMALIIVYIVSVLYSKYGSFTVSVLKYDAMKYALTLSDTPDFYENTSRLNSKASTDITNIDGNTLPVDLDNVNGEHSGDNYAAYTFYCKNAGTETVTYRYQLYIANMTRDIEKAIRVRLYVNGEPVTYARTASDGSGPEPGTTEFKTETVIAESDIENFAPGDVTKYTVVIWLEGNDPDCLDHLIGGEFKIDMTMSVIKGEADGE